MDTSVMETRYCYPSGFLASLITRKCSEASQDIETRLYSGPCYSRGEPEQVCLLAHLAGGVEREASLFV